MKDALTNPFIVSGYESPDYFCDRETETERMVIELMNGNNLTLISPRRMGKTGLIHHAFRRLKLDDQSVLTIYVDLLPTNCLADLAKSFSIAVMEQMDASPMTILKKAARLFSRLRPALSFDPLSGAPKFSVDIAPGEEQMTIEQIFSYLKNSGRQCFVAFDEFQQVAYYPETNVEAFLRSHIQFLGNVHFVFSGSQSHMLSEMFHSPKRPFYSSASSLSIGPIDRGKYYVFASDFFKKAGRDLPEEVFNSVYDRYDGHTWYVQKVLNKLYGYRTKEIDGSNVLIAIREILSDNEYYYQSILRAYSKGQGKLLKAIAKEDLVKEILSGGFLAKYGLNAASSVRGSLKRLLDDEQIYRDAEGYIVYDRFMSEWLKGLN